MIPNLQLVSNEAFYVALYRFKLSLNDTLENISGLLENFYIILFCENNFSHSATTTIVFINWKVFFLKLTIF